MRFCSFLDGFFSITKTGKGTFEAICPAGSAVFSCGLSNTPQTQEMSDNWKDLARYAFPARANACECRSASEIECVAYCGPDSTPGAEFNNQFLLKLKNYQTRGHLNCLCKLGFQVMRSCITTLLAPMTVMFLATGIRKWRRVA